MKLKLLLSAVTKVMVAMSIASACKEKCWRRFTLLRCENGTTFKTMKGKTTWTEQRPWILGVNEAKKNPKGCRLCPQSIMFGNTLCCTICQQYYLCADLIVRLVWNMWLKKRKTSYEVSSVNRALVVQISANQLRFFVGASLFVSVFVVFGYFAKDVFVS